jgi:hypothetical protein
MSVCCRALFARSLVCMVACSSCCRPACCCCLWAHVAAAPTRVLLLLLLPRVATVAPVNPSLPVAMVCMCLLPRLLRFPHTQGPPLPALTSRACLWNTCNTKHLLQHTSEIDETFRTHSCNICVWLATSTYATSRWNTYHIHLKQLKHLKHTLTTYTCMATTTNATSR